MKFDVEEEHDVDLMDAFVVLDGHLQRQIETVQFPVPIDINFVGLIIKKAKLLEVQTSLAITIYVLYVA